MTYWKKVWRFIAPWVSFNSYWCWDRFMFVNSGILDKTILKPRFWILTGFLLNEVVQISITVWNFNILRLIDFNKYMYVYKSIIPLKYKYIINVTYTLAALEWEKLSSCRNHKPNRNFYFKEFCNKPLNFFTFHDSTIYMCSCHLVHI